MNIIYDKLLGVLREVDSNRSDNISYPQVSTYSNLPSATGATGLVYIVLTTVEANLLGLYRSNGTTWDYLGDLVSVIKDTDFKIYDDGDPTKYISFDASLIGTGKIKTYQMPNRDGVVVLSTDTTGIYNNTNIILSSTGTTTPSIQIKNGTTEVFRLVVSPSLNNTFMGANAGIGVTTSTNMGIGDNVLSANTSGNWNLVVGKDSMKKNTTGSDNTVFGIQCMSGNTTGKQNCAFGEQSLMSNTTGSYNAAFGLNSLYTNTKGGYNVAVGSWALTYNTTGTYNVAVGMQSAYSNTIGVSNTSVGAYSLQYNVGGQYNVAVGYLTSQFLTGSTWNTALGYRALKGVKFPIGTPAYNVAVGACANMQPTTAQGNVSVGVQSHMYCTSGLGNIAIGNNAMMDLSTGNYNIAIGGVAPGELIGAGPFVPARTFTIANSAGTTIPVGNYLYRISYVLDGLPETFASTENEVTTTANQQTIKLSSIPTYLGPYNCTARKIYRTVVGTTGFARWLYLDTLSGNTATTYTDNALDSTLGVEAADYNGSIAIGAYAQFMKPAQMVIGSSSYPITEMVVGAGIYSAPSDLLFTTTGGFGTNSGGSNLILAGGFGTGTATGGSVIFKASFPSGSTNTLLNSFTEISRIDTSGLKISYNLYVTGTTHLNSLISGNHTLNSGSSAVIGGSGHTINHTGSVVLGGYNFTTLSNETVYSPSVEIFKNGEGVILRSPNGTRYKLTVDNSGSTITTSL